jgi:hypothetical protein
MPDFVSLYHSMKSVNPLGYCMRCASSFTGAFNTTDTVLSYLVVCLTEFVIYS